MNISRANKILQLIKLNDLIQDTKEIIKVLYAKLDYYIRVGNDNGINRIKNYLLEYEHKLSIYKEKVKLLND